MNNRETPLFWSLPCGTWFFTRVRISVYFLLLVPLVCLQLKDARLGLTFSGILLLSLIFHEFGHILAARLTGGSGNEILIWPMGGLAYVQPAPTFASQLLTAAAGPLVNLAICGIALFSVLDSGHAAAALHPLKFPNVELQQTLLSDLLVLTFWTNWLLFLVNLVPVFPLDGGRILRASLMTRYDTETSAEIYFRVGYFAAIAMMIGGVLADSTLIVFIFAILLVLNVQESLQIRSAESYDESFMGYDFSQGYTSLEKSATVRRERRPGLLERWRQRRDADRLRREQEKTAEAERTVDELLEKVHAQGIDALTDTERRKLKRASERLREKGKERH